MIQNNFLNFETVKKFRLREILQPDKKIEFEIYKKFSSREKKYFQRVINSNWF